VLLGLAILIVQKRRHTGLEPSPYVPGREWTPEAAAAGKPGVRDGAPVGTVQSQGTSDYVDVSEPPADAAAEGTATSTVAAK